MSVRKTRNNLAGQVAYMERIVKDAGKAAYKNYAVTTPVRVHFHSIRRKLADIDGLSGKAVLDGIVEVGLLPDDKPAHVKSVIHTQVQGDEDKTIITIETLIGTGMEF